MPLALTSYVVKTLSHKPALSIKYNKTQNGTDP
jgi:hypothetical protein